MTLVIESIQSTVTEEDGIMARLSYLGITLMLQSILLVYGIYGTQYGVLNFETARMYDAF